MNIITRKHLARRTFLKGLGAAIALPMLDSMVPVTLGATADVAGAATKSVARLGFVYVPNGMVMQNWVPPTEGENFEFSRILKPLEPYRKQTTVISNLMSRPAYEARGEGGGHARGSGAFLTATHPKKTGGSDIHAGTSADQVVAKAIGNKTRLASLELGVDDNRTVGHCDSGYSCAYTNSISWASPTTPLPPETSPRLLFERLFGDFDPSIDTATRMRRGEYRKSILDLAKEDTSRIMGSVGASDKRKIDEYLTSLRDVEMRVQRAEKDERQIDPGIDKPAGIPEHFADHTRLMYDLQVLAFQSDLTRVATFIIGREGSVRTYEEIGIPDPHHPLSHHRNMPEALEKLTKIHTYHMELFAYFVNKLAGTKDGDGTLLDRCMLMYGGGISDSNRHTYDNLPIVVVGGGNGQIKGNQHIALPELTPVSNLFVSLMDRMDVHPESFGDSSGRLAI